VRTTPPFFHEDLISGTRENVSSRLFVAVEGHLRLKMAEGGRGQV